MTDETIKFGYTGIDSSGKRVSGSLKAVDIKEAQNELRKMNIEIIDIQAKAGSGAIWMPSFLKRKKIKPKQILHFTRYLSTMLASGLPVVQALDIISRDKENPDMQKLVSTIKSSISEGKTLAESFGEYPQYFSDLYCNLIRSGEKSGTLDRILVRLGDYLERAESLKKKIKKASVYPIAILSVAMIVSLILLLFVVPQFQKMFESFGAKLPAFTMLIVNLSHFVSGYWWLIAAFIAGLVWMFREARRQYEAFNLFLDRLSLRIYIIGDVEMKGIVARFARTLGTTLEAGIPMVDAMKTMAGIVGNRVYRDAVLRISDEVISGHSLSSSMESSGLFPNMVIQMVSVGEVSGRLVEMLNRVASYYEEEVNVIVDNLSNLLEPVIMVVLGVVIGGFIVAMYLPIFRIGSLF